MSKEAEAYFQARIQALHDQINQLKERLHRLENKGRDE